MTGWLDYTTWRRGAPHTVEGNVVVLPDVEHPTLGKRRDLLVLLPLSYGEGARRYPVLYFQDGQNLFDEHTAFAGEWHLERALLDLGPRGREAIAVGVPNSGAGRIDEYSPFHQRGLGGGGAAEYLRYLLETVRPLVEASFRTVPGPDANGVFGSSLGGLFALYAFFERPDVFGRCGAMSPSLQWARWAPLVYLATRRPGAAGRLYLDAGDREGGPSLLSRLTGEHFPRRYLRGLRRAHRLLRDLGYRDGVDLEYVEAPDGEHSEADWAARLPAALDFLLR